MEKIGYKELASNLFCWSIFVLIGFLFFNYLFGYTLPFLLAWGIAYLIYPFARDLSAKTKISRKACSFALILLLLMIISLLLFLTVNRLAFELQKLVDYMTNNSEKIAGYFEEVFTFFTSIGEKLPIINNLQDSELVASITKNINSIISSIWQSLLESLGTVIPNLAASIVMTLPDVLLVSLITVISCFYFAMDVDLIHKKLKEILPKSVADHIRKIKNQMGNGLKKYFRAYLIIFIITFVELFIGFLILGIDYSFVLALLISFIDFLPVFGTAVVLLPWGVILLLTQNYGMAIGILVLLIITTVVRQIIEPKIVGKSLGVHPILTLITLYIGLKLFGVFGMIFLPIITLIFFSREEKKEE